MDPSLLETEYDVILLGTGLVESILAGALARVGKKVLHLDQNDYYGSNFASFPLEQFIGWTANDAAPPRRYDEEYDHDHGAPLSSEAKSDEGVSAHQSCTERMIKNAFQCYLVDQGFATDEVKQELLARSSGFSIDVNPRLVLSSEELVQMLITSGVGRYLEFTGMERTYMHFQQPSASASISSSAKVAAVDSIWEVPCSKKDVFQSKLLGMVEKRMLMKFLQFVADYGETHIRGEDVRTTNERDLSLGRSLKRPQNKSNQTNDHLSDDAIAPYLKQPFVVLLEKHFKLSPKLQQVVLYCVALASFPAEANQMTAEKGLAAVYRYVSSIGRFTGNAFLIPLYGVGEITQSFCRLSAVYGGIYVLRAPISHFLIDSEEECVKGIRCLDGKVLKGKVFIVNAGYACCLTRHSTHSLTTSQVLRGVFVLRHSLRQGMSRIMCVVPPLDDAMGNPFAVQVVQLDWSACVCPQGYYLVHVVTPLPNDWKDDSIRQRDLMMRIMEKLVVSAMKQAQVEANKQPVVSEANDEVKSEVEPAEWQAWVLWKAIFAVDSYTTPTSASGSSPVVQVPGNAFVCEAASFSAPKSDTPTVTPLEIHLESASANAKLIFDQLCPGEEFLPKSAGAEQAEKEELEEAQDAVLQAAQKLASQTIGSGASTKTKTVNSPQSSSQEAAEGPMDRPAAP